MKSSTLIAILFSASALAGPVKRAVVTEYEIETVTVWVTASSAATAGSIANIPTAKVVDHGRTHSGEWGHWSQISSSPSTQPVVQPSTPLATASPSPSPSVSASVPSAGDVNYNDLDDYAAPILKQHNLHRSNHSVSALQWDAELVGLAKQIADTCVYAHSNSAGDGQYGQNIGAGAPPNEVPKMITNSMYNGEINAYPGYGNEPDMSNFEVWGHFSQIVWKDTQKVGCYTTKCTSLKNVGGNVAPYFTVCNYRPSGNFGGRYAKNVLKPLGDASIIV